MTRPRFILITCVITGVLIGLAILAPEGRPTQLLGLAAFVGILISLLVIFMSAVEWLSRRFSRGSESSSESDEARTRRGPEKPAMRRGRRDRHLA